MRYKEIATSRNAIILVICLLALGLAACTDVQPVVKIGLLAPFEGLYRRTGYEALAAVRAAIAENPVAGIAILPLALDDGDEAGKAQRSAEKLLVDRSVAAIVGPLAPATAASVAPVVGATKVPWYVPLGPPGAVGDDGPVALVTKAGEFARQQGARRLVLAGWTPGWPDLSDETWSATAGLPTSTTVAFDEIAPDDAIFWMGFPADGADFLNKLRSRHPEVPFWLGAQGGDPVFAERAGALDHVYWVIWSNIGYTEWTQQHSPSSPLAYLVYQATVAAIQAAATGQAPQATDGWFVQAFSVAPDGNSHPFASED